MDPAVGRILARQTLAQESNGIESSNGSADACIRASEKLRIEMQRLVGITGYSTLITHAMTLGRMEDPWLESVVIEPDGSLVWRSDSAQVQDPDPLVSGCETLLARTMELLVIFLGETVTLRLLRNIWPELSQNGSNSGTEETQ